MTRSVGNDVLLAQLRWRYAVKKFDPTRKIAPDDWRTLEEALVLTPSSYGLQPWKFIVITDPATKQRLVPLSYNQSQIVDGSHVVVFCIHKSLKTEHVDAHIARNAELRGVTAESLAKYRDRMVADVVEGSRSWRVNEWAANQTFIALGNFMTAAALLAIDTCPMEGFEPTKYDRELGLSKRGLASSVVCVAGYRAADDKYASIPKVRFPVESVIERIE